MPRRSLPGLLLALALLGPSVAPALGQSAGGTDVFEWVGLVGALVPTGELGVLSGFGGTSTEYQLTQKVAPTFGFGIAAWWSRHVGWDATFSYAIGEVESKPVAGGADACGSAIEDCSSDVWLATSRLLVRYSPDEAARWNLYGAGGLAVVGRHGKVWNQAGALTDLGGVLAVGGTYDFSRRWGLRLNLEDYLYVFDPDFETDAGLENVGGKRRQNDLLLSLGVVIRLLGR
jgi:hypothetical protein